MALRTVRTDGDPVLRKKAKKVEKIDGAVVSLLKDMADTMYANEGIGLAANQVGVLKRLIVLDDGDGLLMLVNPVIVSCEGTCCKEEGCLSVPEIYGEVERSEKIVVRAYDEKGNRLEIEADDLLARILQHEIDHLDGKLFIDAAKNTERRPKNSPEERSEAQKEES